MITGSVDEGEKNSAAVLREIDEETGISRFLRIVQLPIVREFVDKFGNQCCEVMYGLITDEEVSHLSEEHIEWEWWKKDEFIEKIVWFGGQEELSGLLFEIEKLASDPNSASFERTRVDGQKPSWLILSTLDKNDSDW